MAEARSNRIVTDLMEEPHIRGRRISVLHVHDWVDGRGLSPQTVADRFNLDLADVYSALAYYHDNPAQMKTLREEREQAYDEARTHAVSDRPPGVNPPE